MVGADTGLRTLLTSLDLPCYVLTPEPPDSLVDTGLLVSLPAPALRQGVAQGADQDVHVFAPERERGRTLSTLTSGPVRPLTGIGNAEIRGWLARLRSEELSASTVRKSFNALSQIMRAAVADRRIPFNPCQDVPLPVEYHVEQRFLTPREVEALAEAIEPRFRALVLLAAYGGLRFGELAGLRRSKLDPVRGRVQIVESLVEANGRLSFGPPKTKRVPKNRAAASADRVGD